MGLPLLTQRWGNRPAILSLTIEDAALQADVSTGSVKETSVCIVDDTGKIMREVKVASEPEALLPVLMNPNYAFKRIGLEAGPLSQWLFSALAEADMSLLPKCLLNGPSALFINVLCAAPARRVSLVSQESSCRYTQDLVPLC
jgi:hypothetical protein